MKIEDGMKFKYPSHSKPALQITHVMLPGYPSYDGAIPGVGFRWLGRWRVRGNRFFCVCNTPEEFFAADVFRRLQPYEATA